MPIQPLILRLRTADEGGAILPIPDMSYFYPYWDRSKLVLLIHGFNVPVSKAIEAYSGFISQQQELAQYAPGGNFAPDRNVVEIFWKGDDWGSLSALYYMDAIPDAVATAAVLADTIKNLAIQRGGLELEVVAHSLGTRLALELIRQLSGETRVAVTHLVFFAAATPTFMLEHPTEPHGLRRAYDQAVRLGARSLFSASDRVLEVAFPIGQTLARGNEGFFPTALGHEFWASIRVPDSLSQRENRNAGHSDYWGGTKKKLDCERYANIEARDFLGFTGLGDRTTTGVATAERITEALPGSPDRQVASRDTAVRPV